MKRRIIAEFSAQNKAKGQMASFRRDMDTTGQAMRRMAKGAMAFVGITGGLYAVKRGLEGIVNASMQQEDAERALMAATGGRIDQFKMYAAEMQRQTVYGDELILQQMAYGTNLGITTNKLQDATKAAIGLAAKYRLDLASSMMLVGRASQGQTSMLTRYGIVMDESLTAQEKFNRLLVIGAESFHLAEEATKTAAGSLEQMKNAWGDMLEIAGEIVLPGMTEKTKETTKFLTENQMAFRRYLNDIREGVEMTDNAIKPILKWWWAHTLPGWGVGELYGGGESPTTTIRKPSVDPLVEQARIMDKILKDRMKAETETIRKAQDEQTKIMQEHYSKVSAMGGSLHEMQERMTRQRFETEIDAFTQKLEAEEQAQKEWWDSVSSMGGSYQEMQERMARQRIETEIAATTLRIEAEEKAAKEVERIWAERDKARAKLEYEAMRAPIIAAEKLERESAERRKRISEDIALSMARSWTSAIDQMLFEGQKLWASMKAMGRSLVREIANIMLYRAVAEPIATNIMAGVGNLFAAPSPLASAPVQPPGQTIYAYPGMASYQHGGIAKETGPAFIHKGERITPAGESPGGTVIHIHNEGQEKLEISRAEEYMFGDQRIIDVTTRAMQTDISYQRNMARAVK